MQIIVDKVINPTTFDPEFHVRVRNVPLDLLLKKKRGDVLTIEEFAVIALIEASTNA